MIDFFKFRENLAEARSKEQQTAMELGKKAFKAGKKRVPINDTELEKLGSNIKNMKAWLKGWDSASLKEQDLEKGADDPCWDGYVQLGTKMKNGKEVPNCVPIKEARKMNESALNERLDNKYFVVKKERGKTLYFYMRGLGGMPDWTDNAEFAYVLPDEKYAQGIAKQFGGKVQKGLHEAKKMMNGKESLTEGVKVKHDRYKRAHGKNASGKGTWIFTTRSFGDPSNNEIYMGKSNQSVKDAAKDAAKALGSDEVYVMESAASLSEQVETLTESFKVGDRVKIKDNIRDSIGKKYRGKSGTVTRTDGNFVDVNVDRARAGEVEFHKRELEPLTESALTESKTVEVSVRDARKANDIAKDMFRGEYKNDGSNSFVFKKADAADDFRAELKKQKVELMEAQSGDKEAYTKFFNAALKRFGADSIADMDDDKKKEFFTYVDKNWESEDEKNESYISEKVNMNETALDNRSITNFIKKNAPSGTRVNFRYSDDMVTAVFIGIMTYTSDDIKTLEKIKTKIEQNADVEDISLDKHTPTKYSIFVKHNSVKTSLARMKV